MGRDVGRHGDLDAVSAGRLQRLADGYHARATRSVGVRTVGGQLAKLYVIEVPGRCVDTARQQAALDLAGGGRGGGLAVVILHAGGDGDYVIVQSWITDYMTRLAVFVGPADEPQQLRPAPPGLGPCVWEAAVLAHERTAFVDRVLAGRGPLDLRLTAWAHDTFTATAG